MKSSRHLPLLLAAVSLALSPAVLQAAPKKKANATKRANQNASAIAASAANTGTTNIANADRVETILDGPQVLNVSPQGDDASAVRGGSQAFATLAAALAQANSGDTVHLMAGRFPLSGRVACSQAIALTGQGGVASTVVPDDTAMLVFQASTQISGINFDSGADATTGNFRPLIDLSGTDGSNVTNCRFHGNTAISIVGNGITNATFTNLKFDHVYLPVFVDSNPTQNPGHLAFRNCAANHAIAGGFIIHSPNAYTGDDTKNTVVGLSSGLDFINCSVKDVPNALAFEIWHGWTDIHLTRCTAEDSAFGFSISDCDHATFTSCQANNCVFLYENAGSHDVDFINCVGDARPTAISPYVGHGVPFGTPVVVCNGPSYAVRWVGGSIIGSVFHTFTGSNISLLGATMSSSTARVQNASDITIQGCTFNQLTGYPAAPNWMVIDCGVTDLANIVFDGNTCLGFTPYAGMEIYGAPHAITNLQITGNHTDGVYNNGGFVHNQGVPTPNQLFAGNTTDQPNTAYPWDSCFPNDVSAD